MSFLRPSHALPALHVLSAALALGMAGTATAGVSYRLDRPSAAPGDTVTIEAVYFNEGNARATWEAPPELVLQWRGQDGQIVRSLARLQGGQARYSVPVNNFARLAWSAEVPASARGLQAVSIEGQPAMMALDATGRDSGTLASTPAQGPVVDARSGQPVPAPEVAAAGASPQGGPSPDASAAPGQADAFALSQRDIRIQARVFRHRHARQDHRALPDQRQVPPLQPGRQPARELVREFLSGIHPDLALGSAERLDALHRHHLQSQRLLAVRQSLVLGKPELAPGVNVGAEHNSNGKDGPDSRSVNDGYVEPRFHYRLDGGSTLTFAPRIKAYFGVAGENPDYADYAGRAD